jgi:hypothetical protein
MTNRNGTGTHSEAAGTNAASESRDEMREFAESLSLYRSAMHHVAEKRAARPFALPSQTQASRALRMRFVLVPALAAALAVAVLAPALRHPSHPAGNTPRPVVQTPGPAPIEDAKVDDTQLMNQIDSDLTEDVPDALAPLADMSDQAVTTTKNAVSEKTHVSHQ